MTFAFDENVSTAIVLALKSLDYPVVHYTEFLRQRLLDFARVTVEHATRIGDAT